MEIEVNLSKRYVFLIVGILLVLCGGIFVYAVVPNPGHAVSAIEPPSPCANNQFLQWTGSSWVCAAGGSVSITQEFECQNSGTSSTNFVDCPVITFPNSATIFKVCFLVGSYHSLDVTSNNDCRVTGTVGGTWTLSTTKRQSTGRLSCYVRCIL